MGVDQGLVRYIMDNLKKGYDLQTIRNYLWKSGYNIQDIDAAIRTVNTSYGYNQSQHHVRHTIHFSKSAMLIIGLFLLTALGATFFLFDSGSETTPSKLLDVEITTDKTVYSAGDTINFELVILSMGSEPRNDIVVRYEILDKYQDVIQYKEEEIALQTRISKQATINIPSDSEPGLYELKTTSTYSGKTATSKLSFRVKSDSSEPSCNDGIQNQNEEGIDCGGVCTACASCSDGLLNGDEEGVDCGGSCRNSCEVECNPKCNDQDLCTEDRCVNGNCVYTKITPCCGNFYCEESEDYASCPADCDAPSEESITPQDKLDNAITLAKTDPSSAGEVCQTINDLTVVDQCFQEVAKSANMSIFCNYISVDEKRDSCYINFAMTGDFTVCDRIKSEYLVMSCEMLRDANKVKEQT